MREASLDTLARRQAERTLAKQARRFAKKAGHTKADRKLIRKALVQGLIAQDDINGQANRLQPGHRHADM